MFWISFEKLVNSVTQVIEKHAPLQIASRRQKRIHKKTWLNKDLLKNWLGNNSDMLCFVSFS